MREVSLTYDMFAETNPAYCAYAVRAFAEGYVSRNAEGAELLLPYLMLPLALSGDLHHTFTGTNVRTGLLGWLEKNPVVQVGFRERIDDSTAICKAAITFACFARLIWVSEGARILPLKTPPPNAEAPPIVDAFRHARRLGEWFADCGSMRAVFSAFGVTL